MPAFFKQNKPQSPFQVRLEGNDPCAGRIQIFYDGQWGHVCSYSWDQPDAEVVCRQLGCGAAVFAPHYIHSESLPEDQILTVVKCYGNETNLRQCDSRTRDEIVCQHKWDAGVICASAVNISLASGASPCAGRMLIKTSSGTATFRDEVVKTPLANVVCTQLGCGSVVSVKTDAYFGIQNVNLWVFPIYCNGNESHFLHCFVFATNVTHSNEKPEKLSAGMVCSAHVEPRLVSSKDPCAGRMEVQFGETWGTFCDFNWDIEDANVVCHQLQCGVAVSTRTGVYGEGSGPVWNRQFECNGRDGPRLVGGSSRCSGRVEVLHKNVWGTLCDKNLDLKAANVICRHLLCGEAISTPSEAYFGEGMGQVWKDTFLCNGNESRLEQCVVSWDKAPCDHRNDASIICSDADWQLQLKGGESHCEGTVQVMLNGTWRQILDSEWDLQDASVVCAQLNCGQAVIPQSISRYISGSGPVILTDINCAGDELSLQNCSFLVMSEHFNISGGVGVLCSEHNKVRLAGHSSQCAGRVEVYYNATWGTVCSNSWELTDAQVVCRQLGCGNAVRTAVSAEFGKSSGPVLLDEVKCWGNESAIWKCPSRSWGENKCQHKDDAGVVCSEFKELRLHSSEYVCAGNLEIFYNGTWGDVCSNGMDSTAVNIICQQLGCGESGLLEEGQSDGARNNVKWLDGVTCHGHEAVLWQCSSIPWGENRCQNGEEARIQCSGATGRSPMTASPESVPMAASAQLETCAGDQSKWLLPFGVTCLTLGLCLCAVSSVLFIKTYANIKKQGYHNTYYNEAVYELIELKTKVNLDENFSTSNGDSTGENQNVETPEEQLNMEIEYDDTEGQDYISVKGDDDRDSTAENQNVETPEEQLNMEIEYDDTEGQDYISMKGDDEEPLTAGYDDVEPFDSDHMEELSTFYDDVDVEDYNK
ncbi:scavenger receptor cysteine-rich type 1 protein M130-like [Polypterus senegalus]|uniref:scavenger receptor cysteine-rich type 1 protein M130-like n=1 Tax=Polypterus senegalus TaxID=55291 RepID=UPI001962A32A|nr:scavenger receptor cysteine-rich type 1 protein M130-like [Polypterus senegalus]